MKNYNAGVVNINVQLNIQGLTTDNYYGLSSAKWEITTSHFLTYHSAGWFLALLIAPSLSVEIGNVFGTIFFRNPLDIVFSPVGMAIWLLIVVILSPAASLLSARKALRQPVHEVLAYE